MYNREINIINSFSKMFSISLLIIFFLVFSEDFIRMNFQSFGIKTYLLKDAVVLFIYLLFFILFIDYPHILKITKNVKNLLFYILTLVFIYVCASFTNFKSFELILLGVRVDLFYWLITFSIIVAYNHKKFVNIFFYILLIFLLINFTVSTIQLMLPEFLKNVPGFYGIYDINKVERIATFHKTEWEYLYGIFTDVGKLNSNLYNIFIWFLIFYFIFEKIKFNTLILFNLLILMVLFFSGKRVYFIFCLFFFLFFSLFIIYIKQKVKLVSKEYKYVSELNKSIWVLLCIFTLVFLFVSVINLDTILFYYKYIEYSLTTQINERFFGSEEQFGLFYEVKKLLNSGSLIFGEGIGLSTSGNQYIIDQNSILNGYEYGPTKLVYELGILGLLQFILFWSIIFFIDFNSLYKIESSLRIRLCIMTITYYHISFFMTVLLGHHYWDDTQNQIHFWAITGTQIFIYNKYSNNNNYQNKILI